MMKQVTQSDTIIIMQIVRIRKVPIIYHLIILMMRTMTLYIQPHIKSMLTMHINIGNNKCYRQNDGSFFLFQSRTKEQLSGNTIIFKPMLFLISFQSHFTIYIKFLTEQLWIVFIAV